MPNPNYQIAYNVSVHLYAACLPLIFEHSVMTNDVWVKKKYIYAFLMLDFGQLKFL